MFYKHLEIQNFRGIDSLEINNINRINLITGRNNCGKTSVLEAIFLLTGMSKPQLTLSIHVIRDMILTEDESFSYLFKNFDFSRTPIITGLLDSQERSVRIEPLYPTLSNILQQIPETRQLSEKQKAIDSSTTDTETIEGLKLSFTIDKKKNYETKIKLKKDEVSLAPEYKEKLRAIFITPATIMQDIDKRLEAIFVREEQYPIINALKEIEPELSDIRMGARGIVYADVGLAKLIPINIMGDGIRRILAIIAAICKMKNGIVLIDEIENGLHFSSLSVLWKAVFKSAMDNNVQLFITTHSYECLEAIAQTYEELKLGNDFLSLFRIERNKNGEHRAFQYSSETLIAGLEKEFEVR